MALGLVWGIGALLLVVLGVLGGISAFFIHVARRSRLIHDNAEGAVPSASGGSHS